MRPTLPLLLITVLQGVSGGLALSVAALWWMVPPDRGILPGILWGALGAAAVGGVASLFHMHKPKAGRFILRRLKTSWLSREALTTGIYIPVLGIVVILPQVVPVSPIWYGLGSIVALLLALPAMYVTAMLYATIPAMRSWHSPITVISMMSVGLLSGAAVAEAAIAATAGVDPVGFHLVILVGIVILAGVKWLQYQQFSEANRSLHAASGTGMPTAPYRLIDSGTTKLPYATQTQVWTDLTSRRRFTFYVTMGVLLIVAPFVLGMVPMVSARLGVAALMVCGAFLERWIFFRDATHSSKVWFGDELRQASSVSSNRVSPQFARRFKSMGTHHQDGI